MKPSPPSPKRTVPVIRALQRELYFFALYRMLEAAMLALVVFSPAGLLFGDPAHPALARGVTTAYLVIALGLLLYRRRMEALAPQVLLGVAVDIAVALLMTVAVPAAASGIALMLVFNVGAAALLVGLRLGLVVAAAAAAGVVVEYMFESATGDGTLRPLADPLMFAVSYLAIASLTSQLGERLYASQRMVEVRSAEAANLAEINELIIRRMRTGVLLVGPDNQVRMANEAALQLFGDAGSSTGARNLTLLAPELAMRLDMWRQDGHHDDTPLALGNEQIEVLPRFVRLLAGTESALVFLDDASRVSRRAETLTLSAMGRFSASLAHEIRNPLAAISYATQLLEESNDIGAADRRLLQIIHQQCLRTNGIVESVLGLARRERANPEHLELNYWSHRFVDDYKQMLPIEDGTLLAQTGNAPVPALMDPRHLQQVLTVLVHNALNYGRMPGEAARITVRVQSLNGTPVVDVVDRGPGIPAATSAQLFRPFFTTSEHGTGLGLYIARELCRANGANLEYIAVAGGGSCFRIALAAPNALLSG